MPHIEFTPQLAQHIDCPSGQSIEASSLQETLDVVFADFPDLRGYLLDDQGMIRKHVAVFIDGQLLHQRYRLDIPVSDNSQIFVMQALSGG